MKNQLVLSDDGTICFNGFSAIDDYAIIRFGEEIVSIHTRDKKIESLNSNEMRVPLTDHKVRDKVLCKMLRKRGITDCTDFAEVDSMYFQIK